MDDQDSDCTMTTSNNNNEDSSNNQAQSPTAMETDEGEWEVGLSSKPWRELLMKLRRNKDVSNPTTAELDTITEYTGKAFQQKFNCAAGDKCVVTFQQPLATHLRCYICGFAVHGDCCIPVRDNDKFQLPTSFHCACVNCVEEQQLRPFLTKDNQGYN